MNLSDEVSSLVTRKLKDLHKCLDSGEDFRICLSILPSIAFPLRGLMDISSNPKETYVSYLIVDQLGNLQSVYDGHTEAWYILNRNNIQELKKHLKVLIEKLIDGMNRKDEHEVTEALRDYFMYFNQLARSTTSDTKE